MIRTLIKYGLLLVVGVVCYNYFLGTPEEQAHSKKIFQEVRGVGKEIGSLLKSEKQKFDKGKYDGALKKVKGVYDVLKDKAQYLDEKYMSKLDDLDHRRKDLEKRLDDVSDDTSDDAKKTRNELKKDINNLLDETQNLIQNLKE